MAQGPEPGALARAVSLASCCGGEHATALRGVAFGGVTPLPTFSCSVVLGATPMPGGHLRLQARSTLLQIPPIPSVPGCCVGVVHQTLYMYTYISNKKVGGRSANLRTLAPPAPLNSLTPFYSFKLRLPISLISLALPKFTSFIPLSRSLSPSRCGLQCPPRIPPCPHGWFRASPAHQL